MGDNIELRSNIKDLELYSDTVPFRLSLKIENFEDEKAYVQFIRSCEKLVRISLEYKQWKNYIIDVIGMNHCFITNELIDEVSIEVHHHVPSLYILIKTLINKKIEEKEKFSSFDISDEAIRLHFMNKIGYICLVKTLHEKFHNGFLTIPQSLIKGDYKYFIEKYSKYIEDSDLQLIQQRLSINESNCTWSKDDYRKIA